MDVYKINPFGRGNEVATKVFNKYAPVLIGIRYQVQETDLLGVNEDWLQGRKATLALVKERSIALAAHRALVPEAIAKAEAELEALLKTAPS